MWKWGHMTWAECVQPSGQLTTLQTSLFNVKFRFGKQYKIKKNRQRTFLSTFWQKKDFFFVLFLSLSPKDSFLKTLLYLFVHKKTTKETTVNSTKCMLGLHISPKKGRGLKKGVGGVKVGVGKYTFFSKSFLCCCCSKSLFHLKCLCHIYLYIKGIRSCLWAGLCAAGSCDPCEAAARITRFLKFSDCK